MKHQHRIFAPAIRSLSLAEAQLRRPMSIKKSFLLPVILITGFAACGADPPNAPIPATGGANSTSPAASPPASESPKTPGAATGAASADAKLTDEITRRINEAMTSPKLGNGIQVLTINGKVILRGTVKNPDEKNAVGVIAVKVAGAENVTNNIECENAQ